MKKIALIFADNSELIRLGLTSLIKQIAEFELIGESKDANSLLKLARQCDEAIVLIDYTSTQFGIDVIPLALQINPALKFIAITTEQSGITLVNAIKSGVTSYIKKDCDSQEIIDSIWETAKGEKFFCGQILETIRKEAIPLEKLVNNSYTCAPLTLSPRELEIISLIAEGYTNDQISEKLFLSKHTVATHRKNIMSKLGVNNTAAIVMYAVKTQLVSPNKFLFSA